MSKLEIKSESEWSGKEKNPKKWQWSLSGLLYPISLFLTFLGSAIMKLGNILMFDTHHLEIKVTPKSYDKNTYKNL